MKLIGVISENVYAEGTRAELNKWLLAEYEDISRESPLPEPLIIIKEGER